MIDAHIRFESGLSAGDVAWKTLGLGDQSFAIGIVFRNFFSEAIPGSAEEQDAGIVKRTAVLKDFAIYCHKVSRSFSVMSDAERTKHFTNYVEPNHPDVKADYLLRPTSPALNIDVNTNFTRGYPRFGMAVQLDDVG